VALRIRSEAMMAVGVEVGMPDSRVLLDDLAGNVLQSRTIPWHENAEVLFSRIHSVIAGFCDQPQTTRLLGVGVALPGLIDPATGRIFAAQNMGWFDVEAGALLRKNLRVPFQYENNARLSALAECWFGGSDRKTLRNFVFVVAREGVGTGIIVDGQILQGARAAAGEFGHATLYPDGKRCLCGNVGCWEQYISERALVSCFESLGGESLTSLKPAVRIAHMAIEGHPIAVEALNQTAVYIGEGLVGIIRALNPEAIVLGDYLAVAWDLIREPVWNVLKSRVHQYYLSGLRILPSNFAIDSSLLGAVALVLSRYLTTFDQAGANAASNSVLIGMAAN
jgi:predicted NBD/HSP70 family sugar kinase